MWIVSRPILKKKKKTPKIAYKFSEWVEKKMKTSI